MSARNTKLNVTGEFMAKLNEEIVRGLPIPAAGNKVHYFPDATLQGAKAPRGFGVRVTAGGVKSFVMNYRIGATERRLTIGQYPDWSVLRAVKEARELRQRIDRGEDPLADRRKQEAASENTFKAICEEYFRRDGAELRTREWRERALERLAYAKLGARPIEEIKRTDVIRVLDDVADTRGPVMADRLLAVIRKVMNWHASRSDDYRSPIVRGMARTNNKERARQRVLTDHEIKAVWTAAETSTAPFARLVRFILLTGARRSEAAGMTWHEIEDGIWTLPAARNKTKVDLLRPLSKKALAVLPARGNGKFVFSTNGGHFQLGAFSLFRTALQEVSGTADWHLHDLRRTGRTLLSRAKVPTDHAEMCLGHVIGGVRGVYDRWEFRDEKAKAYEALAALINRIVNPVANVRAIGERRPRRMRGGTHE
jgi:integrase